MNIFCGIGRLTNEPSVRHNNDLTIARYTIAIDRPTKEKQTDFISCVAFGKTGDFAEKYLHKGTKIAVEGRIQTGSYQKQDGTKVYTTDVVVEKHHFCEKSEAKATPAPDEYLNVPEGTDEEVPFN